jgi:hypothetical protein
MNMVAGGLVKLAGPLFVRILEDNGSGSVVETLRQAPASSSIQQVATGVLETITSLLLDIPQKNE